MSQFAATLIVGAALVGTGILAMLRRRSLLGVAIGFEVSIAGALLLALGLLGFTGSDSSVALVAVVVLAGTGVAAAVLVAALHLAIARAAGSERGLEPW